MSIGETLADERQRAGLSVTQVSLQTRIRETVIRGMEADDFAPCGGNFYARGHIRSVSRVIGIDPEPLVAEFDAIHGGAPQPVSAISAFEPEQPVREFRERRPPNWSAAMALALALVVVYAVVQVVGQDGGERRTAKPVAGTPVASPSGSPTTGPTKKSDPVAAAPRTEVDVRATANRTVWLSVRDDEGEALFTGIMRKGDQKRWTADKKIDLVIGVGGGVDLTVNGKELGAPGQGGGVQRLSFDRDDPEAA